MRSLITMYIHPLIAVILYHDHTWHPMTARNTRPSFVCLSWEWGENSCQLILSHGSWRHCFAFPFLSHHPRRHTSRHNGRDWDLDSIPWGAYTCELLELNDASFSSKSVHVYEAPQGIPRLHFFGGNDAGIPPGRGVLCMSDEIFTSIPTQFPSTHALHRHWHIAVLLYVWLSSYYIRHLLGTIGIIQVSWIYLRKYFDFIVIK